MIILLYLYFLAAVIFLGGFLLASFVFLKRSLPASNASQLVLFFSVIIGLILFISLISLFSQDWNTNISLGGFL